MSQDVAIKSGALVVPATGLIALCDVEVDHQWHTVKWPVFIDGDVCRVDINAKGADPCRIQNIRVESDGPVAELVPFNAIEVRIDGALVMRKSIGRNAYSGPGSQRRVGMADRQRAIR